MLKPLPTWQECFDAGMTAIQAAEVRGRAVNSAYTWAVRHHVKWPDDTWRASVPVRKGKREFKSIAQAARDLGSKPSTIGYHLSRYGNLDRLGIGARGSRPRPGPRKPITIGPMTFVSHKAAAEALGITPPYLSRLLHNRRADLMIARAMKADAKVHHAEMKARALVDRLPSNRRAA